MDDGTLGDCGCGMEGMLVLDCMLVQPARTSAAPTSKPGITGRVFMTYPLERSPAPRSPPGYGCWRDMAVRCFRALAVSVALARELIPQETRRRTCGCGNAQGAPVSRAPDARAVRETRAARARLARFIYIPRHAFASADVPAQGPVARHFSVKKRSHGAAAGGGTPRRRAWMNRGTFFEHAGTNH